MTFLLCLVYPVTILRILQVPSQLYTLAHIKHQLIRNPLLQKVKLSLHSKQITWVINKVDAKPQRLLVYIQVANDKTVFTPIHVVFLELDIHYCHLDFMILAENKNIIIPKVLFLQLLNKGNGYLLWWNKKNLSWPKSYSSIGATRKLTEIER